MNLENLDPGSFRLGRFWAGRMQRSFQKCCFWDFSAECNISIANLQFDSEIRGCFQRKKSLDNIFAWSKIQSLVANP
jgi:hypothetical protein